MAAGPVTVQARPPGETQVTDTGRIAFVDNLVDRSTGTIRVKGTFDNTSRRLWPGQFVNVVVTLATIPDAIAVPSVAVQIGPQGQYVYVVKPEDNPVELRPVAMAQTRGDDTVIQSGLSAGETVVTDGHLRLTPGSRVSIKPAQGEPAPGQPTPGPPAQGRGAKVAS